VTSSATVIEAALWVKSTEMKKNLNRKTEKKIFKKVRYEEIYIEISM